jgi:hypothetical protein
VIADVFTVCIGEPKCSTLEQCDITWVPCIGYLLCFCSIAGICWFTRSSVLSFDYICMFFFFCWLLSVFMSRAVNILAEMRSTLGLNDCKLLCINSSTQADGSDADNSWLPYVSALNFLLLNCINFCVVEQVGNLLIVFSWLTAESAWLTESWRSLFP